MKELSIEEKAKRYDEALIKARNIVNSINVGLIGKDSFEAVFPELKESGDERIRKALIKLVKKIGEGYENVIDGISIENAISWLEKQGEQKPTNIDLDTLVIKLEETIGTSPHSRETIKKFFQEAIQKYLNALQEANKKIGELVDENYYLKEQKPVEWSEENKCMLNNVIDTLKPLSQTTHSGYAINSMINWLKSLKPQSRQEWSVEDDKKLIERLKSLRPQTHWKPSDEQMNILEQWLKDNQYKGDARYCYPIFESLYQDLKKLKG